MRVVLFRPTGHKNSVTLKAFSDSDSATDLDNRKSQSSCFIEADGCPLSSYSKRQAVVSTRSAVAELYAATGVASAFLGTKEILTFFGLDVDAVLLMDASTSRAMAQRHGVGILEHLETRSLWFQEVVHAKLLRVAPVRSKVNKADLGTRILSDARVEFLQKMCGCLLQGEQPPEDYPTTDIKTKVKKLNVGGSA